MLSEIAAVLFGDGARWRGDGDGRFRTEQKHPAQLENKIRALPDLVSNRRQALQISRHCQRVLVRHLVKPFVRHYRREQTSVFSDAIAERSHYFGVAPHSDSGLRIRSEIRGPCDSDPPIAEFHPAAERSIGV